MRTTLNIDDELIQKASKLTGIEAQMKINPSVPNDHREALLICHCFGYTKNDLVEDFACNGKSLIMERIMAEKKLGGCQCATKNPSGK